MEKLWEDDGKRCGVYGASAPLNYGSPLRGACQRRDKNSCWPKGGRILKRIVFSYFSGPVLRLILGSTFGSFFKPFWHPQNDTKMDPQLKSLI